MRLLSVCLTAALSASLLAGASNLSGRRAPGFSLPTSSFRQYDLADYRGKIVLLDFMKTSCLHCQTLSHILEEIQARYGDRVVVLSVVHPPDSPETVKAYAVENKIATPILFDCGQMAISYMKVTPGNARVDLPHLFLIDGEGWIRNDYGYSEQNKEIFEGRALHAEVERMLKGAPAKPLAKPLAKPAAERM